MWKYNRDLKYTLEGGQWAMTISAYINVDLKAAKVFRNQYTLVFIDHIIVALQGQWRIIMYHQSHCIPKKRYVWLNTIWFVGISLFLKPCAVCLEFVPNKLNSSRSGPFCCLLLGVSSGYAQPTTWQVTEVACPVIGRAQPEPTPSKIQKTGPAHWLRNKCLLWK